jgi:hypothetical protein
MNEKEKKTGRVYREWTDILNFVRKEMNKIRKKKLKNYVDPDDYPAFDYKKAGRSKFKIGDIVHYKLDYPENALGHKQPTSNFRVGDFRYSNTPRKIIKILYMNDYPYYRYMLEGINNASYSDYQLLKSKYKNSRFKVKKIIGDKLKNNKRYFLIWWVGYKKSESTWEPEKNLRNDGLSDEIEEYLNNN